MISSATHAPPSSSGVGTGWTGVDVHTTIYQRLLLRFIQIPVSFRGGPGNRGVGHVWSLTRQFAKYREQGEFAASVRHRKADKVSASVPSPYQGLCLWTTLGLHFQTSIIGSRSAIACVSTPRVAPDIIIIVISRSVFCRSGPVVLQVA